MCGFVNVVVTVATVMHFTFGCCLHAAHFGPAAACHDCADHEGDADAFCIEHECECDAPSLDVADASHPDTLAVRGGNPAASHACAGCTCAASTDDEAAGRFATFVGPLAALDAIDAVPASVARVDRARDRGGSPPPRDMHPLHERLLV